MKIEKLWLIDDDFLFRACANILLNEVEFAESTELIESGQKAIEKLQNNETPDFIFLDINMPEMNGWQFLDEVKKQTLIKNDKTLIYILSSTVDPADFERAEDYDIVKGLVRKPLTSQSIADLIKEMKNEN